MAEEAATTTTDQGAETAATTETASISEAAEEAALPEGAKKALAAARKEARDAEKARKALEAQVNEFQQRDMTEQQKLEKRAKDAETALPALQSENARLRVAIEKNLPADLVDRLKGTTVEELSADADKLLSLIGGAGVDFDGGTRASAGAPTDMNQMIRGALRH